MARAAGPAAPATVPRTSAEASSRATRARGEGHVVVISGLSGAGKSQASKLFEDLGYYCVDNLPPDLLDRFLALRDEDPARYRNVALVLDIRAGDPAPAIEAARAALVERGVPMQVLYLEAEAAGVRATGIGCFFDDPVHQVFGLRDLEFQSLYHFTVGGYVDDPRLTTLPPYGRERS